MSSVNEWPTVKLGEVVEINPKLPTQPADEEEITFVPMAAVEEDGFISSKELRPYGEVKRGYTPFLKDDLLVAKITPCFQNKKIAAADIDTAIGIGSTEFHVLRTSESINPRYLLHFLRQDFIISEGEECMTGSGGQRRVPKWFMENVSIPLPPLDEQQRIAEILDSNLQLSEQVSSKISLLEETERTSYLSLFSGEPAMTSTQEIAADHKTAIRTGPFGSQLKHDEFVDEGIAVLGLDNVVSNKFRWVEPRHITAEKYEQLKRYTVHPGDVLISIMGTTGRCAIVPDEIPTTINTKHICAITTDRTRMLPEFLRASFLWHPHVRQSLRQHTKGAIMSGLNMGIIKKLPLPVPDISRQQEWVRITQAIDTVRQDLMKQQSLIQELSTALQNRAFQGSL